MSLTKVTNSMVSGAVVNVFDFMTAAQLADVQGNTLAVDVTSVIQAALNFAALDGKPKVVYAPTGRYKVLSQIIIPFGIALIGENVARKGQPGNWINMPNTGVLRTGTDFFTNAGKNSTSAADAFVFLNPNSKVANINVWYIDQTVADNAATIVPYAPTFTATVGSGGGNSDNVVIENCSALNCYTFIYIGDGTNPIGRAEIVDCWANPFGPTGIRIRTLTGDLATITRCYIENWFTTNTNTPEHPTNALYNYIGVNLVAFDLENSLGVTITDSIALHCKTGVKINSVTWANINNLLVDYAETALVADGAARVSISNSNFVKTKGEGASVKIGGIITGLAFSSCSFNDGLNGAKTGAYCYHTSGTVKFSCCNFTSSAPGVLNTSEGAVEVSACGIGYGRVVGKNISVNGGPILVAGTSLGLANINPTVPAATGWTFVTPGNVTAITGGVRIQGPANNTIEYRPASISAAENGKIFWNTQTLLLEFDYKVTNQPGSPGMQIVTLSDIPSVVADNFQLNADLATNDSGLPAGETFHVSVILPWSPDATTVRLSLPGQSSSTIHEITNFDIKFIAVPAGCTGLEWYYEKSRTLGFPIGMINPKTGGSEIYMSLAPTGGTWKIGDIVYNVSPTAGGFAGWICVTAGTPGTWKTFGAISA